MIILRDQNLSSHPTILGNPCSPIKTHFDLARLDRCDAEKCLRPNRELRRIFKKDGQVVPEIWLPPVLIHL